MNVGLPCVVCIQVGLSRDSAGLRLVHDIGSVFGGKKEGNFFS